MFDDDDCVPVYQPSPIVHTPESSSPFPSPGPWRSEDRIPSTASGVASPRPATPCAELLREAEGVRYARASVASSSTERSCLAYMTRVATDFQRVVPLTSDCLRRSASISMGIPPVSVNYTTNSCGNNNSNTSSGTRSSMATALAFVINQVSAANERRAVASAFDIPKNKHASMSFQSYVYRWVSHVDCPMDIFVAAAVYIDRVNARLPVAPCNVHRIWATSVLLALKMYSDFLWTNARYADVAGIPLTELNALEIRLFALLRFNVVVSREEYQKYAQALSTISRAEHSVGIRKACCSVAREMRPHTPSSLGQSSPVIRAQSPVMKHRDSMSSVPVYHIPGHDIVRSASALVPSDRGSPVSTPRKKKSVTSSEEAASSNTRHKFFQPLRRLFGGGKQVQA